MRKTKNNRKKCINYLGKSKRTRLRIGCSKPAQKAKSRMNSKSRKSRRSKTPETGARYIDIYEEHIISAKAKHKRLIEQLDKQDLTDNLIRQLSEASLTLDQSRCLSGRIARIIQSLEAIDAENIVNIASSEDIRRELSDKVPVLIAGYTEDLDNKKKGVARTNV